MNEQEPALHPEDLALLGAIMRGNEWLRGVSCTLARRGAAFRMRHPERAESLLQVLSRLPLYKAGQFMFDLFEWEDFMLDGPPPPIMSTTLDVAALKRLESFWRTLQSHVDGSPHMSQATDNLPSLTFAAISDADLPPLKSSFYLYQDVVLGVLVSAGPALTGASAVNGLSK